jgi:hypothetical protein
VDKSIEEMLRYLISHYGPERIIEEMIAEYKRRNDRIKSMVGWKLSWAVEINNDYIKILEAALAEMDNG